MSKLDKMCYTEFIEHLDSKGIKYEKEDWLDEEEGEFCLAVKPINSNLKERSFSHDGGWQIN
jgi:hypothetical protein